jgi:Flp pilus assembly protein TadG
VSHLRPLLRCERGASASEFALVAPLLLIFLLGIIDVGRLMWTLNQAEKATQMGVRYAVVSNPVATMINVNYVTAHAVPGGDVVPTTFFNSAVCSSTSCTVSGSAANSRDGNAFDDIVEWMQKFYGGVTAPNVFVTYQNVGLGYSGNPHGPDVSPLTTVELRNLTFAPMLLFGGTLNLPTIKASLTYEDGQCVTAATTGDYCGASN